MDGACISDIMAHIRQYEWGINMVGTSQVNQIGADAKATITGMKTKNGKENYESHLWQHNKLPLVFAAWE